MADEKHVERLKRGVKEWNQWRQEHPGLKPDLSGADLSLANLSGADFGDANLGYADLTGTDLGGAYFSGANLGGADLRDADLSGADLGGAYLYSAYLNGTDLDGVDLANTYFQDTVFIWVDLSSVKGLKTAIHGGPSTVNINSVILPHEESIRNHFLRGTGFSDQFIDYLPSLMNTPIQYQSCFISYSSKDDSFAKKLYADLQKSGVRCWFALHDLKWGEHIRPGIDKAIHLHERVLLILSRHALASGWVEDEVKKALSKERKQKQTVLFPVRVDKAILESPLDWATEIRHERNIGNFTRWKDDAAYQQAFARLLQDLKVTKPSTG